MTDEQAFTDNPKTITFTARTISRSFRDAVAAELPGLGNHQPYWRMLQYLLFGTWRDTDTKQLMLPRHLIAAMEERSCDKNYSAVKFLNQFQLDVGIRIDIDDYIYSPNSDECKPRTVRRIILPDRVTALAQAERTRSQDADRVWMDSGNKWLRKHTTELRVRDREAAKTTSLIHQHCAQSQALVNYLNNLPPHRYSSALKHMTAAEEMAVQLKDAENQLNILRAIRDQSQPFYSTVEKSVRVYSIGDSMLRLHRDLRQILTQDWITADLKSAQLAIVAKVWNFPALMAYLLQGNSIWQDLCNQMAIPYTEDNKAIVKAALYAITFGAGKTRLIAHFARQFESGAAAYARFKAHDVIRTLLLARSRQLRAIRVAGGGVDAFGREYKLIKQHKQGYEYLYDNSRSILACIAQSYELMILLPVVTLAIQQQFNDHGFTLTTWLHDGFTLDAARVRDLKLWKERLASAVDAEAKRLGILTQLEFSSNSTC